MPALHIQDAVKTYANGFTALRGVSFDVAEGEFSRFWAPTASKTTLITAMAGLEPAHFRPYPRDRGTMSRPMLMPRA